MNKDHLQHKLYQYQESEKEQMAEEEQENAQAYKMQQILIANGETA